MVRHRRTLVASLVLVILFTGCQSTASRAGRPTLTPILLPRVTQPAPAAPSRGLLTLDSTPTPRASKAPNTPRATESRPTTTRALPLSTLTPTPVTAVSQPRATSLPSPKPAAVTGKIAWMTAVGEDIYLLDASGKVQRLTAGIDPALSPDGTQLAFTRWESQSGLFVRDLRTGDERQVAAAQKPRSPTWHSDGQRLAFIRLLQTVTCRESVFGCLDEGTLRARFGGRDCAPTPFGLLCIFDMPLRYIDQTGIVEVGLDGTGWLDIPAPLDAQGVAWRPRSEELLYRGNGALQITGRDRSPADLVKDAALSSPAWSLDGARFVAQARMHDHTEIALFDASGRLINYLTKPLSAVQAAPHSVAPAWSPDGESILFLSNRADGWKIYRMTADGTGQVLFRPDLLKDVQFRYDFVAERVASWAR